MKIKHQEVIVKVMRSGRSGVWADLPCEGSQPIALFRRVGQAFWFGRRVAQRVVFRFTPEDCL